MKSGKWEIDRLVRELQPLLRRTLRPEQRLSVELSAIGCRVRVDRAEFELALLNVMANARDAMPVGGSERMWTAVSGRSSRSHFLWSMRRP